MTQYQTNIRNITNLLAQRRADEAVNACLDFARSNPESNDALLLLGKARQMQGRFEDMLQLVETALGRDLTNVGLQIQFAGACQFCGHHTRALSQLNKAEHAVRDDADLLQSVARLFVQSGRYEDAHRCYLRAVELHGTNAHYLNNLAASYVAIGDLRKAEDTYSSVIRRRPKNYEAWYNLSTLRKQTVDSNDIRKLEKGLNRLRPNDPGETPLCYALAKNYEDLGNDKRSFHFLRRGAGAFRRNSHYDVQRDVMLMKRIAKLFDAPYCSNAALATERRGPIFVLGLPRSGTTLVDRIIGSHSDVTSMGEITDFALALNRLGGTADREQLLDVCSRLDPDQLAEDYLRSVASYGVDTKYFIDKTPINYLYVGLIAKALPGASVIHVQRHPVDSCLSMYRALFRTGYPFSYDLDDLANYYITYDELMKHWQSVFPDVLYNVSYEALIENQESVSRKMISHCGLGWESACLEFEKNTTPVATASAVQVRRPIYRDAMRRWRRFETQLAPLIKRLREAGIAL